MPWLQLRLDTRPDQLEILEELLLASGAASVTLQDNADQPVLEPAVGQTPLWRHTRVTGLYPAGTDMESVVASFPSALLAGTNHRVEILEDKDWEREWMQHYQPMQFGDALWVCPSWLSPPDPTATTLLLDPGLAFGTGTHPTTALCLEQLAGLPLAGAQVVDYGCGSGILAVAALKLGASRALAVDNDPQALVATRDNARRNHIEDGRLVIELPADVDHRARAGQANVVVANILAGPLLELADILRGLLQPGGTLLLSGLLLDQAPQVQARYAPHIQLAIAGEVDAWVCLRGTLADAA